MTIALVSDSKIREYNRRFLGRNYPTDVIAFWYDETPSADYLGDIAISVQTAARNAQRYHLSLARELKNLIIHGILHLLGYDHESDSGQMRALEKQLRRALMS